MMRHLIRLIKATRYSAHGIKALWRKEQAFRLEIVLSVILTPIIFSLPIASLLKLALILLLFLVLVVEAINSALEVIVDRISLEIHEQSKIAKDMGSAAVALVVLMNLGTWLYVAFLVLH